MAFIFSRNIVIWGIFPGIAAFFIDRFHKYYQLDIAGWSGGEFVPVTPFLDYVMVWNRGVSYGLLSGFPQPVVLGIVGIAFAALFWWWIVARNLILRVGLSLCLGGALSNIVDRWLYGAVADFFHLYLVDRSLFVFNLADAFIFVGALFLILDAFMPRTG